MSKAPLIWLLVASPRNPATGAIVPVRLAGGGTRGYNQFGETDWRAGLDRPPALVQRLGFNDGEYGDGALIQAVEMRWGGTQKRAAELAALYWRDAPFTLYSGPDGGADGDFAIVLAGRFADVLHAPAVLTLQMADPGVILARPVLTATFAGTGGIEGIAELKGRFKRRGLGKIRNVELWPLDTANNIWVATDPAHAILAFDQVYDRGNAASALTEVAWAGSFSATLTALAATACPAGGAAIAPSIACIKWWFAQPGKLTCDLRGEIGAGYIDKAADIAAWIVSAVGGPVVNAASLAAARALRGDVAGILVSNNDSAGTALTALLSGVSLWWGMTSVGEMEFGAWEFGASGGTIMGASVRRVRTHQPVKKITIGYRRNNFQMSRGDIAAVVFDAAYADGTPVEALRPAQAGATNDANLLNSNLITRDKKPQILQDMSDRESRYTALISRLTAQSGAGSAASATQLNALASVRLAFNSYVASLVPALSNVAVDTPIVRADFDMYSGNFNAALDQSDKVISEYDATTASVNNSGVLTGTQVVVDNSKQTFGALPDRPTTLAALDQSAATQVAAIQAQANDLTNVFGNTQSSAASQAAATLSEANAVIARIAAETANVAAQQSKIEAAKSLAATFPRTMNRAGFTGVDRTTFAAPEYEDALSPDGKSARIIVGTSGYGYGLWCREVLPYDPAKKIKINATIAYVVGASSSYVAGWSICFDEAGNLLGELNLGTQILTPNNPAQYFFNSSAPSDVPIGTAFVRYGILVNREANLAVKPVSDRVDVYSLYPEDITNLKAGEAALAASLANAASAATSDTLAGQKAAVATDKAAVATTKAAEATLRLSEALVASSDAAGSAASAATSASISAGFSSNLTNKNAQFANWTSALPTPPNDWIYAYSDAGQTVAKVAGDIGGYAIDLSTPGSKNWELAQSRPAGSISAGWYVLELDIEHVSGDWKGAGLRWITYDAAGNGLTASYIIVNDDRELGTQSILGSTPPLKRYKFVKIVNCASLQTSQWYLGLVGPGFLQVNPNAGRVIFRKCGFRSATDVEIRDQTVLAPMQATVAVQAAVLATHDARLATYLLRTQAGNGTAEVRLEALDVNGISASKVGIVANEISLENEVNGEIIKVATFEGGVARIKDALLRNARVSNSNASQIYHEIELKPLTFLAADGQIVQYQGGNSYFALPRIEFDASGLPSLAAGESYEIAPTVVGPTAFTAKVKRITGGSLGNQTTGAGSNVGGTPQWQVAKPTVVDANNNLYQFSFSGLADVTFSDIIDGGNFYSWQASYEAQIAVYYAASSGLWTQAGTINVQFSLNGTSGTVGGAVSEINGTASREYTYVGTISIGSAIGQHGGTEFGLHPVVGSIDAFNSVQYTTQSSGSATPVATAIPWKVYPPNT